MRITMTEADAEIAVNLFRSMYYEVPEFWSWCKSAVFNVTRTGGRVEGPHGLYVHAYGEFLFIHLPSGRQIAYHKPLIVDLPAPWDKEELIPQFTFMGRDKFNHKWARISAHDGHICENCIAEGTSVYTDSGWKNIEDITEEDLIHDGIELVNHTGLLYSGVKQCVEVDGVKMTPDHEVLNDKGEWQAASEDPKPFRPKGRKPNRGWRRVLRQARKILGVPVHLWGDKAYAFPRGCEARAGKPPSELRVLAPGQDRQEKHYPRYVPPPSLLRMEKYEMPMRLTYQSGMGKLRGQRDYLLRKVEEFQKLLGGHGGYVPDGANLGEKRQQQRVLPRKLRVDYFDEASSKPPRECQDKHTLGIHHSSRSLRQVGDKEDDTLQPSSAGVARGKTVPKSGQPKQDSAQKVYDITNCGPRQRFVVKGTVGPVVVHNCVQAIARDILGVWMIRAANAGHNIVLHVHDEIAVEDDKDVIEELNALIRVPVDWAPGLLLDAEGFTAKRYRKG